MPLPKTDQIAHVDTISALSDPLSSMANIDSLVQLLTLAYQAKPQSTSDHERLSALMRILTSSLWKQQPSTSHSHDELLGSFIHFLSPVLHGMAGLKDFKEAVGAWIDGKDFRDFWMLEGDNLIREMIGGSRRSLKGRDLPFLKTFVPDGTCRVGFGRDSRKLFLVAGDAQIGDEVRCTMAELASRMPSKNNEVKMRYWVREEGRMTNVNKTKSKVAVVG